MDTTEESAPSPVDRQPDLDDVFEELEQLAELVDSPDEQEQVIETMRTLRRSRSRRLVGRLRDTFDTRDVGEALVGSFIFGIPMVVEGGTLEVGAFIAGRLLYLGLTAALGLAVVLGILRAVEFAKVEEEFNARPSRLELSRRNSPADAVKTSMDVGGYFSVPRIREDSQELGHETLMQLGEEYQSRDRENFDVEQKPRKIPQRQGFSVEGHTTLELVEQVDDLEPDVAPSHEGLVQKLEEEVIDGKRRYEYSVWEDGNYMVFDKERDEPFEITIEDRNIVLHAKPATSSVTLRDFCDIIRQEFNTTYRLEKTSEKVGVL